MSKQGRNLGWVRSMILRKRILFAIGVVIIAVVAATWWFVSQRTPQSQISKTVTESVNGDQRWSNYKDRLERGAELRKLANQALASGDARTVGSIYDEAVDAELNVPDKVELRLDQAKLLYGKGLHDEAITVAKSAEALGDDQYMIADWLSRIYERRKEYDEAARYYALASRWVQSPTNQLGFTKQHYDKQVERVQGLAKEAS